MKQSRQTLVLLVFVVAVATGAPAADKSGVSPNTISLPSGPGSIEGLGEAFQPTLNTGTGKHSVEFVVPSNTAGQTPTLTLRYEGGSGNGPLGIGWDLPLPYVQRQCEKGIPRYVDGANQLDDDGDGEVDEADEADVFINEVKEELVPHANGDHFCENESTFVRYRRVGDHWEGTLPDGTRLDFGVSSAARVVHPGSGATYRWLLERSTDSRGNTITYSYMAPEGPENQHQKYLSRVEYGPAAPPWGSFHLVVFSYEPRPDWFEDCRSGFCVRTGMRLVSVSVATQGVALAGHLEGDLNEDGTTDALNRRYELRYDAHPHWSLLSAVQLVGADGTTTLPPAKFSYTGCSDEKVIFARGRWIGAINEPQSVMDNPLVALVDLNSDGLPDILKTDSFGGVHRGYVNLGESEGENGKAIRWAPFEELAGIDARAWNVNLESKVDVSHLADMDGDGLADLTYTSQAGDVYYFENHGNLEWGSRRSMSVQDIAPPSPFGSTTVRTADLDFDKRIDVVQSIDVGGAASYRIWFNLGAERYAHSVTVSQATPFLFSQQGVELRDVNGDRLPDVVKKGATGLTVATGLGHGRFAPPVLVPLDGWTLDTAQLERSRLEDVTGDGLADLVVERAAPGQVWFWVNLGNYTLSSRRVIVGLPTPTGEEATTRWADLNGNGTTDLIYADRFSAPRLITVDIGELMGCVPRPHLLKTAENGIGRRTTIYYRPSTYYALADAADGNPWPDSVPFPVSVISEVRTADSLGNEYVTQFRYHEGYYDSAEKEFRGFARVERNDVGDPSAPTLVTRSYFDTGHATEALKGKTLRVVEETEAGAAFTDTVTTWETRTLGSGTDGKDVVYAHAVAERREILELGHGTPRVVEKEFSYDNYGNRTQLREYGISAGTVAGNETAEFDDERFTTTEYALNLEAWILRHPRREDIADENGVVISRAEFFYDDPTFSASDLGVVTRGDLTLKREWIDPSDPGAFIPSKRVLYDVYGNPTYILDPLADAPGGTLNAQVGHYRHVLHDPALHAYPLQETVHLENGKEALTLTVRFDSGLGVLLESIDFNSQTTTYAYDPFGRLLSMTKPRDNAPFPTLIYEYVLAQPLGDGGVVNYIETRQLDRSPGAFVEARDHYFISRTFYDGLGRALMTKEEAESDPQTGTPRVVVQNAVRFNAREKTQAVLQPFYSLAGGALEELLAYEPLQAPGWQGQFESSGELLTLNLTEAQTTLTTYDATLRVAATTQPDGSLRRILRQPLVESSFDENDSNPQSLHHDTPLVHHMDGLGRLIRTDEVVALEADGSPAANTTTWATSYSYDLNDRLTRLVDAMSNEKELGYDGLKRKVFMDDPDRGKTIFAYDAASNLTARTDNPGGPDEQVTLYTYDGANRRLSEDYVDEGRVDVSFERSPDVLYHYDVAASEFPDTLNLRGHLSFVEDLSGGEYLSYDRRDQLAWRVKRVETASGPKDFRMDYVRDSLDRVTATIYPDGESVSHHYNERTTLESVPGFLSERTYEPSGQVKSEALQNGVVTSFGYNSRLWLTGLHTTGEELLLQDYAYSYDAVGNIVDIDDGVGADADPTSADQAFHYDDLYRLTLAESPVYGGLHYRYDPIGNILSKTADNADPTVDLGTFQYGTGIHDDGAGPHAVRSVSGGAHGPLAIGYDANGNYRERGDWQYAFDFEDRLVRAENTSDGRILEYTYDHTDRRILKRVIDGSVVDETLYPHREFEVRGGREVKYVFAGERRLARVESPPKTATFRRPLVAGWNLVSIPLEPATATLSAVLESIDGAWQVAALYQGTSEPVIVLPGNGNGGDEQELHAGDGFWLYLETAAELVVDGTPRTGGGTLELTVGWNLVGGGSLGVTSTLELAERWETSFHLWTYDAEAQAWQGYATGGPHLPGTLTSLDPGAAYWIFLGAPSTRELPTSETARTRFYHPDHLGSANFVTDEAGALVETTEFYPFGEERVSQASGSFSAAYRYTGKERDTETGLVYYGARYYDPVVGRFASPDPLYASPDLFDGKKLGDFLGDPQKLSLYSYALNNPVVHNDPDGREALIKITGSGKNIKIEITLAIKYTGKYATKKNIATSNAGIEKLWKGKYGKYTVKTKVVKSHPKLKPAVITLTDKLKNGKPMCGTCGDDRSHVANDDTGRWNPHQNGFFMWMAAHEAGHLLGIEDHYTEGKGVDKGWEGNMMGEQGGIVQEKNFDELVKVKNKYVKIEKK